MRCRLCSLLRWRPRRRAGTKVVVHAFRKHNAKPPPETPREATIRLNARVPAPDSAPAVRLATFNAAMFSMAPAVPGGDASVDVMGKAANDRPRGILKRRGSRGGSAKRKVSINLPDNEISAAAVEKGKGLAAFASPSGKMSAYPVAEAVGGGDRERRRSVMEVLREVGADVVAVQSVRADEEQGMRPLSELAAGLGMGYAFAESWAPEYGNAILSRWPIREWEVQRIVDDDDIRNVLKATIDVPRAGEINFYCTYLDHLDEDWRLKQISKILQKSDRPHILAGGLNALDETDYSAERWADIVKYYAEIGKPTPKVEVTRFLREKQYLDAKNFAGECESVVVVAKGQDVQGTCKYGTRVDYILASPNSPYKFVPGSYMVHSSKGTSDHHIVRVDIRIANTSKSNQSRSDTRHRQSKPRVVSESTSQGIWKINS